MSFYEFVLLSFSLSYLLLSLVVINPFCAFSVGVCSVSSGLKEEFLRLLREDIEFRYAVMGLLGIEEILKRIDRSTEAIRDLQQQVRDLSLIHI